MMQYDRPSCVEEYTWMELATHSAYGFESNPDTDLLAKT